MKVTINLDFDVNEYAEVFDVPADVVDADTAIAWLVRAFDDVGGVSNISWESDAKKPPQFAMVSSNQDGSCGVDLFPDEASAMEAAWEAVENSFYGQDERLDRNNPPEWLTVAEVDWDGPWSIYTDVWSWTVVQAT